MENGYNIINIGRQFGSGGKLVALRIGSILGIDVYDNELISKAAEKSGFSKDLLSRSDEKRSFFNILANFDYGKFAGPRNFVGDGELFGIQGKVITEIADNGPAIFVGRCSNYILRDRKCLNVFISSPEGIRAERVAGRCGISTEEAAEMLARKDRQRKAYYNFFTFGNWGDAADYDLCIDSSILGIEGTAEYIIEFGKRSGLIV